MKKKHFIALGAAALMLGSVMSACNKEDDITKKNPNSILEEIEYKEGDTIKINTVVMSFDRFANKDVPEVTIANSDTTILMVQKSFLERNNMAIKDTNTYISVWDKPSHLPFLKKVVDAEDAGDEIKVIVKDAHFTEIIGEQNLVISMTPYYNANETPRNADGSFNPNFYINPENGEIHPVAFFVEDTNQGNLQKAGEEDVLNHNMSEFNYGLIENYTNDNLSLNLNVLPLSFSFGKKTSKSFPLAEGKWGKLRLDLGLDKLDINFLFGINITLNTSVDWIRANTWFPIWYPSVKVDQFLIGNYGKLGVKADAGIDLKFELEKGQSIPTVLDSNTETPISEPFKLDPAKHTKAGEKSNSQKVADELNKLNGAYPDNYFNWPLGKVPVWKTVVFVGIVPVTIDVDLTPEIRLYPPKVNADVHLGININYERTWYGCIGYAANNGYEVTLGTLDKIRMKQGWHPYVGSTVTDKSLKLSADMNGSVSTKLGLYVGVGIMVEKMFYGTLAIGPYIDAKAAGTLKGLQVDFTDKVNFIDNGTEGDMIYQKPSATFGAGITAGLDIVVAGQVKVFDYFGTSPVSTSVQIFKKPILKFMASTEKGTEFEGVIEGEGYIKEASVIVNCFTPWNFEMWPENDLFTNSFLFKNQADVTIPAITVDGVDIPETIIENCLCAKESLGMNLVSLNLMGNKNISVDGKDVTIRLNRCHATNAAGTTNDINLAELTMELEITIDGEEHIYNFKSDTSIKN